MVDKMSLVDEHCSKGNISSFEEWVISLIMGMEWWW
jgi:hypothetical protein